MTGTIRDLDLSKSRAAARILAAAFDDEPVFLAALPDPADRHECLTALFLADIRNASRYGGVHALEVPDAGLIGIVYWTTQPEPERSDAEMAELGFTAVFNRWGSALNLIGEAEGRAHEHLIDLPTPWRYLAAIGVLPGYQGRGYGTAMLNYVIAGTQAVGQALALSTDRAINVRLYERVGFEVVHHEIAPGLDVPFWTMRFTGRREPVDTLKPWI